MGSQVHLLATDGKGSVAAGLAIKSSGDDFVQIALSSDKSAVGM